MAKFGEGDKRWIVEDRSDGTNVHNWHWAETDFLEWSRALLSKLLSNLTILAGDGNLFIRTKNVDKVDGQAYVNIRKGKIIPGYELSVALSWEGEQKDSDGKSVLKVDGNVDIPYISDENADEDPEIRVYVQSMAQGGPGKDELEAKKVTPKAQSAGKKESAATAAAAPVVEKKGKETNKKGCKTITMTEKFSCRAKDLYEILLDQNRWKGFTQSDAQISKEVGGEFAIFNGSATGNNVDLQDGKLIVQKWRFGTWPDGMISTVRLVFDEPEAGFTIVKLTHTDIPEEDRYGNATVVENTERGWRNLIFHSIHYSGLAFESFVVVLSIPLRIRSRIHCPSIEF